MRWKTRCRAEGEGEEKQEGFSRFLATGLGLGEDVARPWPPMSSPPGGEGGQGAGCHRTRVRAAVSPVGFTGGVSARAGQSAILMLLLWDKK